MSDLKLKILLKIESAFECVKLGNGVGLFQAQGIDDYESSEICQTYRNRDEKEDWRVIPLNDLNYCNSSLSFFDAEGMRFYLPAFMAADIQGGFKFASVIYSLTSITEYSKTQFSLLNSAQRESVSEYLAFMANHDDYEFEKSTILRALDEYWNNIQQVR